MTYQDRKQHDRKRKSVRVPASKLPERVGHSSEEIDFHKFCAEETGTEFRQLESLDAREGGGILWAFSPETKRPPQEIATTPGSYGRSPLNVKRDPVSGMYDIAR